MKEKCKNCEREIGNLETALRFSDCVVCPECFEKLRKQARICGHGGDVQLIEKTSKGLKFQMIVGVSVAAIGGVLAWTGSPISGLLLVAGGGLFYILTLGEAWWRHG